MMHDGLRVRAIAFASARCLAGGFLIVLSGHLRLGFPCFLHIYPAAAQPFLFLVRSGGVGLPSRDGAPSPLPPPTKLPCRSSWFLKESLVHPCLSPVVANGRSSYIWLV